MVSPYFYDNLTVISPYSVLIPSFYHPGSGACLAGYLGQHTQPHTHLHAPLGALVSLVSSGVFTVPAIAGYLRITVFGSV